MLDGLQLGPLRTVSYLQMLAMSIFCLFISFQFEKFEFRCSITTCRTAKDGRKGLACLVLRSGFLEYPPKPHRNTTI